MPDLCHVAILSPLSRWVFGTSPSRQLSQQRWGEGERSRRIDLRCRFRSKVSTSHRDVHWSARLTDEGARLGGLDDRNKTAQGQPGR